MTYTITNNSFFEHRNYNGDLHCINGPALKNSTGEFWFKNGLYHRENGPAIIYLKGREEWFLNGKRHREDGPAIIDFNGKEEWFLNDERHRIDGPAIIDNSKKYFFIFDLQLQNLEHIYLKNNKLFSSKAIKNSNGLLVYLINDCFVSKEEFDKYYLSTLIKENNLKLKIKI